MRQGLEAGADDAALLEAHVAGDPDAFGMLFARHRDRLWAVSLRTTGNPEDAADALQDAMISAFRRAESFRGQSAVTTWLHRIVVNACLDRLRRAKVRLADALPDDLDEQAARGTVLASPGEGAGGDPGGDPEAHALASDRRRRVLAALDQLPPDQKAALVLVDMEGYPVREAGEILEVPAGTIKSRCARGRARLAVLLADLGPVGPPADLPEDLSAGGTPGDTRASHPSERVSDPPGHSGDPPGSRPRPAPPDPQDPREEVSNHE